MIIDGTKLSQEPAFVMRQVQDFLGLENLVDEKNFYFDQRRKLFCFISANKAPTCTGQGKGRSHNFPVAEETKQMLRDFFVPFNQELARLLEREPFQWDF